MNQDKQLPTTAAGQGLATTTGKRSSLVGRGMAAILNNSPSLLAKDNDALYRQFRDVYNRLTNDGVSSWCENEGQNLSLTEVFNAFVHLAAKGYGKAYYPLSTLYSGEQSIKGDREQAERYSQLAYEWLSANQHLNDLEICHDLIILKSGGDPHALWELGEKYSNGFIFRGFYEMSENGLIENRLFSEVYEQHDEKAEFCFRKSAETGDCYLEWKLGELYSEGRGVPQDLEQAAYWYSKAAKHGDWYHQNKLGWMYHEGCDVEQNDELAVYWFRTAAVEGDADAQEALKILGIDWENT